MLTTFERGKMEGRLEGRRDTALVQLEVKFGTLAPEVKQRVEALPLELLDQLLLDLLWAQSLKELRLED
jgi:Domain of unknown function (DUF4351)